MLAIAPLRQSESNTGAGHGAQEGLNVLMQPLPPAACCLRQDSSEVWQSQGPSQRPCQEQSGWGQPQLWTLGTARRMGTGWLGLERANRQFTGSREGRRRPGPGLWPFLVRGQRLCVALHRASSRDRAGWPWPSCAALAPAVPAIVQCSRHCRLPRFGSARGGSLAPVAPASQTLS